MSITMKGSSTPLGIPTPSRVPTCLGIPTPQKGPGIRDIYPRKGHGNRNTYPPREQRDNITFPQLRWQTVMSESSLRAERFETLLNSKPY